MQYLLKVRAITLGHFQRDRRANVQTALVIPEDHNEEGLGFGKGCLASS